MRNSLLRECIRIAKSKLPFHPDDEFKHFAFVIQDGKIIEWGTNRATIGADKRIIRLGYESWQKLHAEIDACRKARGIMKRNEHFDIVNIRFNQAGLFRRSAPCPICFENLKSFGCRRVYYSTDNEFSYIRAN